MGKVKEHFLEEDYVECCGGGCCGHEEDLTCPKCGAELLLKGDMYEPTCHCFDFQTGDNVKHE